MTNGRPIPGVDDSLLNDLRELQAYAAQFQSVINRAKQAAPARASAYDSTGAAFAEIDSDGMPTTLKISRGWTSSLSGAELGPALTEAYQTAIQQHMEEWSDDLSRQGWQFDAREFDEAVAQAPTPEQDLFPAPSNPLAPRAMSSIIHDVPGELDPGARPRHRTPRAGAPGRRAHGSRRRHDQQQLPDLGARGSRVGRRTAGSCDQQRAGRRPADGPPATGRTAHRIPAHGPAR
ncbi:hypothetical protein [Nocardioides sp. B-3]|uniref:hypothetical protein n=1 Tax=Nocardioides sp. B-3 TaxID=2895565 RepID=UPI002152D2FE|nr:hypothetical protein [Nocardioides sp. B-3]UUZ61111.1 hypothetical protein LP418_11005 [Nocardioides sp. B-3]